jgi:hypothetical protein
MLNAVGIGFTIGYQQNNGIVGFSVMKFENGRNRPLYYFNAGSLLRLQADHPEEVRQFLVPLFRCWMIQDLLTPGATDVYGVFTELEPLAAVLARVAEILPRLDSESFSDRDTASQDLAKLGSGGVQAAMRIDRGKLSFEQSDRIDAFIDRHRRRLVEDPKVMRGQIDFLLDCLEDEDASVRAASKASIEKVVGHPVRFDVAINGIDRADAVDELRKTLKKERDLKAATQPS